MNWISATGRRPCAAMPTRHAGDHVLGERRVLHALLAELLLQPDGRAEHAAVHADVLAEHDDARSCAISQASAIVDRPRPA